MSTPPLCSSTSASSGASSSASSTSSSSPTIDFSQLSSEESLDILLQTISQNTNSDTASDESSAHTPPDWEQLAAWARAENNTKMPDFSDFNFSLPMDLDFDPNMAIDPSALHFGSMFDQGLAMAPENLYSGQASDQNQGLLYPTTEDMDWLQQQHIQPETGRRLSITSSSSSGASLSPVMDNASVSSSASASSSPPSESYLSDPAQELAHKVRQMAGVTLAVPVSAQVQQMAAAGGQAKLPIPRLPRPSLSVPSRQSPPKSVPSPDSSSSSLSSPKSDSPVEPQQLPQQPPVQSVIGRPKTSHTTIERRYRTNLNARITGLKQAVPALRVLEAKANNAQNPFSDVVDSRGFVDGVKVARKMSKANVLGKAAEYIKVLKKREARLKREQDGLKSLIAGLVGGPALLKEWEREWRESFGGEEKDEIEDEGAAGGSDDEDGDGEDSDDEEGRARKKPKVSKPAKKEKEKPPRPAVAPAPVLALLPFVAAAPGVPGAAPEKRKRGRPRKNPLPPIPAAIQAASAPVALTVPPVFPMDVKMEDSTGQSAEQSAQQAPAQQYLLAAFAFFSVFNNPLATRTHTYTQTHTGHAHQGRLGMNEVVQGVHLLVSTLVFFYVIVPWLSGALRRARGLSVLSSITSRIRATVRVTKSRAPRDAALMKVLLDALHPTCRGSPDEAVLLRRALGVSDGVLGLMQGVIKAGRVDRGIELNQLEQRAWVRLGELVAFDGKVGKATRMQTYWCMSWHISTFAASTTDLSTLAMIREFLRPHEKIVLDNMSVDDAAEWLEKWQRWHETERKGRCAACEKRTPLGVLAAILIRARLRKHAAALFVRTVVRNDACAGADECAEGEGLVYNAEKDYREEQERTETVQAGKSIGGRTAELAVLLERIWDTGFCMHEDVLPRYQDDEDADCEDAHDLASKDEAEIRSLLSATIIYRRIFPSSFPACSTSVSFILSPPPSPSQRNAALHMALRTALGSRAFEFASGGRLEDEELAVALEDSRDRVCDMLVELEKSCRRGARFEPGPLYEYESSN
ncbi:uncharacterized protein B0H18DRAFT_1083322 [Fomitopsis serialis]|uniref:uncharacterized protein n=1 Tax=Fomitopsis serialis TaxID=139415 RepID=UPI0020085B9C|nr:uncharacterized protein B0H18DRAFT_1083322 [Neoantrodia serialis]KAH9932222.1 hypothetical protein B0H18DRAFT_1083322 [Neoantrodia serialis]